MLRLIFLALVLLASWRAATPSFAVAQDNSQAATTSQRLAHTLGIIARSTPEHPQVLRVLFYGQSITSPKWTEPAVAHLRQTYPNTRFDVRNMAIGGFASQLLERTVERDLAEFYPDLIVFHAYGDHRAYERIVRMIRSRTAADVILQTDHVTVPVEPVCPEGLHLTLSPPPGCKGFLWYKQNSWEEFFSGTLIPQLADRYGAAVDPRRTLWNAYLSKHKLQPEALLADRPHPNAEGWRLMAALFEQYFDHAVADYHGEQSDLVTSLPAPKSADVMNYSFDGNRVELVARGPLDGKVITTVDGRKSENLEGCWLTSRTSVLPNVKDWPAIRQVSVAPNLTRPEHWTVRLSNLNADQSEFHFTLTSDVTGPDGEGQSNKDFTSRTGHIRIEAKDWTIHDGFMLSHERVPEGYEFNWSRGFICRDENPVALEEGGAIEVRHVLATGLENGPHQLSIDVAPDALPLIREVRVYRPPLRD